MDDTKRVRIDATSLLDLKAELYRKQESVKQVKLQQSNSDFKKKPWKLKNESTKKEKASPVNQAPDDAAEEEIALQKSRLALESKAKLYEKIVTKRIIIGDEENENYLVDFDRKMIDSKANICPKDTKSASKLNACEASQNEYYNQVTEVENSLSTDNPFSSTVEVRTEFCPPVKQTEDKFTNAEEEGPIHYQNVQFNEVRDHGVGYFAFSTDENQRKEQLNVLNTLRQQTEEKRNTWEKTQQKKSALLQARLAKICQRRNIDISVVQEYTSKNEKNDGICSDQTEVATGIALDDIPLPESIIGSSSSSKPQKMRPWDIGKDDIENPVKKMKKFSQKEWLDTRRTERVQEFAPPSSYRPTDH